MLEAAAGAASAALLVVGATFSVIGGIGILRLPNFFARIHGAGITDTMGAGAILVGLMLDAGVTLVSVKLIMILALLWLTGPTATHALAKAALTSGVSPEMPEDEEAEPSIP